MEKFVTLKSAMVPLNIDNLDTDQIIPSRFLKATTREGFGENLFYDWRYDDKGNIKPDFILNNADFKGKILLAGKNFGCGSSREHAAWAIYDHGFRVVISSFFADIFKNNCLNIGLLPVQVSEELQAELFAAVEQNANVELLINLESQKIELIETDLNSKFEISKYKKKCLLNGYDDIDYLVSIKEKVVNYEKWSTYLSLT